METNEKFSPYLDKFKLALSSCDELLLQIDKIEKEIALHRDSGLSQLKRSEESMKGMLSEALTEFKNFWAEQKLSLQDKKDALSSERKRFDSALDTEIQLSDPETFEHMFNFIIKVNNLRENQICIPKWTETNLLQKLKLEDLGFFKYSDTNPEDFLLKIDTPQSEASVGNVIAANVISLKGKIGNMVMKKLEFSIKYKEWVEPEVKVNTVSNTLDLEKRVFSFTFLASKGGVYIISVQLYGHEVLGSPCFVPVYIFSDEVSTVCNRQIESEFQGDDTKEIIKAECQSSHASCDKDSPMLKDDREKKKSIIAPSEYSCKVPPNHKKCQPRLSAEGLRAFSKTLASSIKFNQRLEKNNFLQGKKVERNSSVDKINASEAGHENSDSKEQTVSTVIEPVSGVIQNEKKETNSQSLRVDTDLCKETNVIAKWSDQVWYRASIISKVSNCSYQVRFIDYGNEDIVEQGSILTSKKDIPKEDIVDVNVNDESSMEDEPITKSLEECGKEKVIHDDSSDQKETAKQDTEPSIPSSEITEKEKTMLQNDIEFRENMHVIAKWSEDQVWYRGVIVKKESDKSFLVNFIDYGNEDVVELGSIVTSVKDIPDQDVLDVDVVDLSSSGEKTGVAPPAKAEDGPSAKINPANVGNDKSSDQKECKEIEAEHSIFVSKKQDKKTNEVILCENKSVIAKWNEDQVWYRAVILSKESESSFRVKFIDYGNEDIVELGSIVTSAKDIPDRSEIDANVNVDDLLSNGEENNAEADQKPHQNDKLTKVGDDDSSAKAEAKETLLSEKTKTDQRDAANLKSCLDFFEKMKVIAKWGEDQVWYRGEIVRKLSENSYMVKFIDYGNEDIVDKGSIVTSAKDIPSKEIVDENIDNIPSKAEDSKAESSQKDEVESQVSPKKNENKNESVSKSGDMKVEDNTVSKESNIPKTTRPADIEIREDMQVIARWSEDKVWYRARILKQTAVNSFLVKFIDYGNEDTVDRNAIVTSVKDIPEDSLLDVEVELGENSNPEFAVKAKNFDTDVNLNGEPATDENSNIQTDIDDLKPESSHPEAEVNSASDKPTKHELELHEEQEVIAKWSEDQIWYRGVISKKKSANSYLVQFIDYGNEDLVESKLIVTSMKDIPNDAVIDENVVDPPFDKANNSESESGLKVNDCVYAKWSEDETWYRAVVTGLQDNMCCVFFKDYGNDDIVEKRFICKDKKEIPHEDLQDLHVKPEETDNKEQTTRSQNVMDPLHQRNTSCSIDYNDNFEQTIKDSNKTSTNINGIIHTGVENGSQNFETIASDFEVNSMVLVLNSNTGQEEKALIVEKVGVDDYLVLFIETEEDAFIKTKDIVKPDSMPIVDNKVIMDGLIANSEGPEKKDQLHLKDFLAHHDKELKANGHLSVNTKLKKLYLELEKWKTGDIAYNSKNEKVQVTEVLPTGVKVSNKNEIQELSPFALSKMPTQNVESRVSSDKSIPGVEVILTIQDLLKPFGLTMDDDHIYIASKKIDSIFKYSKQGKFIQEYGNFTLLQQILHLKQGGFAIISQERLLVTDDKFNMMKKLSSKEFGKFRGLAQDENRRIYSINKRSKTEEVRDIVHVDPMSGKVNVLARLPEGNGCGLITYFQGRLYLSDIEKNRVLVYSTGGTLLSTLDFEGPEEDKPSYQPCGIAVHSSGIFFVADFLHNRIKVYGPDRRHRGYLNLPATQTMRPSGMILDGDTLIINNYWGNSTIFLKLLF